jgi:hypothetical protein
VSTDEEECHGKDEVDENHKDNYDPGFQKRSVDDAASDADEDYGNEDWESSPEEKRPYERRIVRGFSVFETDTTTTVDQISVLNRSDCNLCNHDVCRCHHIPFQKNQTQFQCQRGHTNTLKHYFRDNERLVSTALCKI